MENWVPLAGVVIAQFGLLGLYFLKQRGDDQRRWLERRLSVYSDFLALGQERTRNLNRSEEPREQREAYEEWKSSLGQILLLGSTDVRDAASKMVSAYLECLTRLNQHDLDAEDAFAEMHLREARLIDAVRSDLKIEI